MRIFGTFLGVFASLIVLTLGVSDNGQMVLIIISGMLYFGFRRMHYAYSTAFITFMILLCFELLHKGFIGPERIIDTVLGAGIAWLAVTYIWPDWKFRKVSMITNKMVAANCQYLKAIQAQYHAGREDTNSYLTTRDQTHTADAEIASLFSSMSVEPKQDKAQLDNIFRLVCLNHTLLGYLTALGLHRALITDMTLLQWLDQAIDNIITALQQEIPPEPLTDGPDNIAAQQMLLISAILPELVMCLKSVKDGE
jgi:uncharacterized membrane protein YccC